jgi:alpha-tubulin suppressor-like RCC1 family protein
MNVSCGYRRVSVVILSLFLFFSLSPRAQDQNPVQSKLGAGTHQSIALISNGTVWSWGGNPTGELGLGDNDGRVLPTQIESLENVIDIATDYLRTGAATAALLEDGRVFAWGGLLQQQTAPEPARIFSSPMELPGVPNIVAISVREFDIFARTSDLTIWRWEWAGDSTQSPIQMNAVSNVIEISGALALSENGKLWNMSASPVKLLLEDPEIVNMSSAVTNPHFLILKSDGTVWAWGSNTNGQLGIGNSSNSEQPQKVVRITKIIAIVAAHEYSIALDASGFVWSWGTNTYGQLGDGTKVTRFSPIQVPGLTDIVKVAAGWEQTLALDSEGNLWAWGSNKYGQLGNGQRGVDSAIPVQVQGLRDE